MKSRKVILFGACLCVTALAVAALAVQTRKGKPVKFVPYTVTWQMTEYYADGRVVQSYTETRTTSRDGDWHSVIRFPNGKSVERIAEAVGGTFIVDPKTGERRPEGQFPERLRGDARGHRNCVRSERVLDQEVDILRFEKDGKSHELYHARRLNNDIIKTVYRDKDVTRVLEPMSIILEERKQ
jgi:hypothetical protein